MNNPILNPPNTSQHEAQTKVKELFINRVRRRIFWGSFQTYKQFKKRYPETAVLFIGLYFNTATSKLISDALGIPYSKFNECAKFLIQQGKLIKSTYKVLCPVSQEMDYLYSTNPMQQKHLKPSILNYKNL